MGFWSDLAWLLFVMIIIALVASEDASSCTASQVWELRQKLRKTCSIAWKYYRVVPTLP